MLNSLILCCKYLKWVGIIPVSMSKKNILLSHTLLSPLPIPKKSLSLSSTSKSNINLWSSRNSIFCRQSRMHKQKISTNGSKNLSQKKSRSNLLMQRKKCSKKQRKFLEKRKRRWLKRFVVTMRKQDWFRWKSIQ